MSQPDWITEILRPLPPILTSREALGVLPITRRYLYRLIADGRIHAVKPTTSGPSKLFIPRSSLERYLRSLEG